MRCIFFHFIEKTFDRSDEYKYIVDDTKLRVSHFIRFYVNTLCTMFFSLGKIPKVDRKYRRHTIDEKYLGIQEKRVDIPIVDNKDFR